MDVCQMVRCNNGRLRGLLYRELLITRYNVKSQIEGRFSSLLNFGGSGDVTGLDEMGLSIDTGFRKKGLLSPSDDTSRHDPARPLLRLPAEVHAYQTCYGQYRNSDLET